MCIASGSNSEPVCASAGNLMPDSQYFIASTTKIYVAAQILNFEEQGLLSLDDKLARYLPQSLITGLNIIKGKDFSSGITLRQLLSNTSGIPDYFLGKKSDGKSLEKELISGEDSYWSFEDTINLSKTMKSSFAPGKPGKALYSDTNFQLLGSVVEKITGLEINEVFKKFIFDELEFVKTYLFSDENDTLPAPLYYKNKILKVPLAMKSFRADGGIVSTAGESLRFLRAFFGGKFFPVERLKSLYNWNPIFFPLKYGTGVMQFKLPRIFSPFSPAPEFIGHSGLSGAFAFYCPEKDVYLAGTVNQIADPGISFRLMLKVVNEIK
ncbi:MAG: beta-lactamase family protein [Ignavibacteriaceae bacterium]|nr:beta-lactamase family protein [Ignavibacteriaceae bacterium]